MTSTIGKKKTVGKYALITLGIWWRFLTAIEIVTILNIEMEINESDKINANESIR